MRANHKIIWDAEIGSRISQHWWATQIMVAVQLQSPQITKKWICWENVGRSARVIIVHKRMKEDSIGRMVGRMTQSPVEKINHKSKIRNLSQLWVWFRALLLRESWRSKISMLVWSQVKISRNFLESVENLLPLTLTPMSLEPTSARLLSYTRAHQALLVQLKTTIMHVSITDHWKFYMLNSHQSNYHLDQGLKCLSVQHLMVFVAPITALIRSVPAAL